MDVNPSASAGKEGVLPCLAQYVHILLVDHDTTSLMSLASQFEQQLYKVTSTESAKLALGLFQQQNNYYDIVIVDISMPEMGISEFVEKLHGQRRTVPIILISEELTMDSTRKAIENGVCYVFSKSPSLREISDVWHHILRVTGKMPGLFEKTNSSSVARNQQHKTLKMKLINSDKEKMKRKNNQMGENSNSSSDTEMEDAEMEDADNTKKPRLNWNSPLEVKFLQAIETLGEHGARPKTILKLMNEPHLTARQINSHFQNYRKHKRESLIMEKTINPVMPSVLPEAPLNTIMQGQVMTYSTASSNTSETPQSVQYSFNGVNPNQDAFKYSSNNC